ncbi:MAG: DUF3027 domain-containing protein [Microbacterium sp.]
MPELETAALAALHEVTPASTVGEFIDRVEEPDGAFSLRFATTLLGYVGWRWTVTFAGPEGEEPTVLEVALLPGEDSLLAPEWVPWSVRLEEFKAAQAAAAEQAVGDDSDDEDSDDDFDDADEDEDEDDDFDDDVLPVLHAGDVDED